MSKRATDRLRALSANLVELDSAIAEHVGSPRHVSYGRELNYRGRALLALAAMHGRGMVVEFIEPATSRRHWLVDRQLYIPVGNEVHVSGSPREVITLPKLAREVDAKAVRSKVFGHRLIDGVLMASTDEVDCVVDFFRSPTNNQLLCRESAGAIGETLPLMRSFRMDGLPVPHRTQG